MAIGVFVAEPGGPHRAVMAAGAFGKAAIENDHAILVRPQEFQKGLFRLVVQLGHLRPLQLQMDGCRHMLLLITRFRIRVHNQHVFLLVNPVLKLCRGDDLVSAPFHFPGKGHRIFFCIEFLRSPGCQCISGQSQKKDEHRHDNPQSFFLEHVFPIPFHSLLFSALFLRLPILHG